MKVRWLSIVLIIALLMGAVAAPVSAQDRSPGYTVSVTGGIQSLVGDAGTFEGTLTLTSFDLQGSDIAVNGLLDGTLFDAAKSPIGNIRSVFVTLPVETIRGSCERLLLQLGPVGPEATDSDIALNPIVLDFRADFGTGKLLGNLLCTVARLLDNEGPPSGIANLLNQILRVLSK
jgi:hypothetical protein